MSRDSLRTNKDIVEKVEQLLQAVYEEKREFNEVLDGIDPVEIPSLNPDQDDHRLEISEVLFWTDRNAYNDELAFWEAAHSREVHQEAIDHLTASDQRSVFQDLVGAIRRNRIAPFVGAGMSRACEYPLWGAALEMLIGKIEGVDADAVRTRLAIFDYLGAAQILWEHDSDQVKNFIRTKFAEHQISLAGVKGPITLLPKFGHGCLITTNFDPVIEIVVGRGNLEGYMHGMQQGNKFVPKLLKGDRCILKLHGDAEDWETYVFTEAQYEQAYGNPLDFKRPLPRALRQIFVSYSLLFLGCSMEQDRTLNLFQHVRDQGEFEIPDHFAILPEPAAAGLKNQKDARLLPLKIRPIWYPANGHEFVERYLALAIDMAAGRISSI